MRIAVYGATGTVGSRIVTEALSRGHDVTQISRHATELVGDALDPVFTEAVAEKHDVIVSAIGPSLTQDDGTRFPDAIANLAATLGERRLLVVGGAGSLLVNGVRLFDDPGFPADWRAAAFKQGDALEVLRRTGEGVDWTYLSPAPTLQPGERTGRYVVGLDSPVGDVVSAEDYAVALVDEIERPAHRRLRFTVAN